MDSPAAEALLTGTVLMESRASQLWQKGGGPAVSLFQIEPATFDDVFHRYLWHQQQKLFAAVHELLVPKIDAEAQLAGNQFFACAIARVKYWMAPDPLPDAEDVDGLAEYWERVYNANPDKGHPARWAKLYRKHVLGR